MEATDQVNSNHAIYNTEYRQRLERDYDGCVALMHDGEVVEIYDDDSSAYWAGVARYELGNFSLVWIGAQPADLGIISAAL